MGKEDSNENQEIVQSLLVQLQRIEWEKKIQMQIKENVQSHPDHFWSLFKRWFKELYQLAYQVSIELRKCIENPEWGSRAWRQKMAFNLVRVSKYSNGILSRTPAIH